jgi:uncharacterized membrane protein YsdA (DUF1294 family)
MMTFEIGMGVWVVLANVLAYVLFLRDKRAAIRGARRIPEDRLLAVAFLGGWLGAKLAQHLLRHKIRTEPFRQQLNGIIAVQVLALAAVYAMYLVERGALMRGLGG